MGRLLPFRSSLRYNAKEITMVLKTEESSPGQHYPVEWIVIEPEAFTGTVAWGVGGTIYCLSRGGDQWHGQGAVVPRGACLEGCHVTPPCWNLEQ